MPLKGKRWLPKREQTISPPEGHLETVPEVTDQWPTIATAGRHSSLHAHPRVNDQPQPFGTKPTSSSRTDSLDWKPNYHTNIPKSKRITNHDRFRVNPRRTQLDSQGTVVVNREARNRNYSPLGLYPPLSPLDDLRRKAEQDYYERRDPNGTFRRRSMMRTVSKEDYLLGRGANPRTGLVMPGGNINSNIYTEDVTPNRKVTPIAKWRQRGDQWISLDMGEPTPDINPRPELSLPVPQAIVPTFPQSLHNGNKYSETDPSNTHQVLSPRVYVPEPSFGSSTRPVTNFEHQNGETKYHPQSTNLNKDESHTQATSGFVRRKPIEGSPPKDIDQDGPPPSRTQYLEVPFKSPYLRRTNRSSSAPALHQDDSPTPKAAGSSSMQVPEAKSNITGSTKDGPRETKNFLGVRSQTLGNLSLVYRQMQPSHLPNLDKELPCLPTNNGPYQLYHSIKHSGPTVTPKKFESPRDLESKIISTPRTTKSMSRRSHIVDMITHSEPPRQDRRSEMMVNHGIYAVPNYDNPPQQRNVRPAQLLVAGPRVMPVPQHPMKKQLSAESTFINRSNITSMSTDTFILTSNNHAGRKYPNLRTLPRMQPPPSIPLPPIPDPFLTNCHKNGAMSNITTMGNQDMRDQTPHTPPRHPNRPQLASHPVGMRHVPQIHEIRHPPYRTPTEYQNLSSTIGTPATMVQGVKISENTPLKKPEPMQQQACDLLAKDIEMYSETKAQPGDHHLKRKCSRCVNGLVTEMPLSTDGTMDVEPPRRLSADSAHAPEVIKNLRLPSTITEVTEPCSAKPASVHPHSEIPSANILDVAGDLRDHSICCPDCCKLDCHEGCLGHPTPMSTPLPSPTKSFTEIEQQALRSMDSSSTLVSNSGESFASAEDDESKKGSFMKTSFKVPFWSRRVKTPSPKFAEHTFKNHSTILKANLNQEVKTSPSKITKDSNSHEGAVRAAKKAIGMLDSGDCLENGLNQFMIHKRQVQPKKSPTAVTYKDKVIETLTPPATPPQIKLSIAANECRKISGSRPCSGSQSSLLHPPQGRTVSSGSTDIRLPSMDSISLASIAEFLLIVPIEAIRMWLHNHPEVLGYGWSSLDYVWLMGCAILATNRLLLHSVYVYSKTGKFKVKDTNGENVGTQELVVDVVRSTLFFFALMALLIVTWRIMGLLLLPLKILFWMTKYLLGVSRKIDVL